jgi:lipid-A-disaccharide synthase
MVEAAKILNRSHPQFQFILPLARTFEQNAIASQIGSTRLRVIEHDTYNAIAAADLAVVASGTATLEAAIIGSPLIVVYRASRLNWRIFRPLINTPFVGMPNLIAEKEIAPELLQYDLNEERLAKLIVEFLSDSSRLQRSRDDLAEVRKKLGEVNASERAASRILDLLGKSPGAP